MSTQNLFEFEDKSINVVARAQIPATVKSKEQLFDALSEGLSLPEYFGRNWDALDECLQTLDWLPAGSVAIVHEALPDLEPRAMAIYLDILKRAVERWGFSNTRALSVVFPPGSRNDVERVLRVKPFR